jgi:hypothetical protein
MAELTTFAGWRFARQYRGPFQGKIIIADIPNIQSGAFADISSLVTQLSVNYSMDMASQLSFEIVDPGLKMAAQNFFILGRDIIYETQSLGRIDDGSSTAVLTRQLFEISSVTASQGAGGSPSFAIDCYSKAVQQMKRDKQPSTVKGQGTEFIRQAARKYGLKFFGQETTKKQQITKASGEKQAESLWDVMKRLADDAKFVLFEVDGTLVFASEKYLLHKWGINSRTVPKFTTDSKGIKKQTGTTSQKWIPLQFPNESTANSTYIGTPGYFKLTEYPQIRKSDNDPYAADGSCTVERINGTQIRPGMTAYVGNVPNMSGFYLIESVSFDEMSSNPVSVSFRTPTRDEQKDKPKLLPIGITYQQTYVPYALTEQTIPVTVAQSAKNATGRPINSPSLDARLLPLPDASNQLRYPRMPYANLTTTYPMEKGKITKGKPGQESTGDADVLIMTGNINLYNRPVLPVGNSVETVYSMTHVVEVGSEWRAILLPLIYTDGGLAVQKTEAEVIAKYEAAGGYSGSAKYLAVLSGTTKEKAILNARDYGYLISKQQSLIFDKRFPTYVGKEGTTPNTAGDSTSNWT